MKIGIDVSQLAFENTGVANYLKRLTQDLFEQKQHTYILFYSSLRKKLSKEYMSIINQHKNVQLKQYAIPPAVLDYMWNRLHILPIEMFIGNVDIFITSDWTEPPSLSAKKASILYDLIVYKHPEETHNKTQFNLKTFLVSPNIVDVQKRKHKRMKKESEVIFCISDATKKDAENILKIPSEKLHTIYPGI